MFKKALLLSVLFLLAIVIISEPAVKNVNAKTGKVVKLQFASFDQPSGFVGEAHSTWARELEKRTQGRFKVEIAWGAAMGKAGDHYDLVHNGIADVAFFSARLPAPFPLSELVALPWNCPTFDISVRSAWELYQSGKLDKAFNDLKVLLVWAGSGNCIFLSKEAKSIADLKGRKILASGSVVPKLVKAVGATPVSLSIREAYPALEKGVVDGCWLPWVAVVPFKLEEVTEYCLEPVFGSSMVAVAMNINTFKKMPKDVQTIVDSLTEEVLIPLTIAGYKKVAEKGNKVFTDAGGTTTQWSSSDMAKMNKVFEPVWDEWISAKKKDGLSPTETCDAFWSIIKDFGVDMPAVGYEPKK